MKNYRRICLFISFMLLPVTLNYFSPYLIIDGMVNNIMSGAFIVWSLMFATSLFLGRAFCSYICPYGGLQMTADLVLQKPLKQVGWLRKLRYALGIIWIGAVIVVFIINVSSLKIDFLYLTESFASVDNLGKLIFYYVLVVLISLAPIFLGKRATCHYLCPMSILNVAGNKLKNTINLPSLRLKTSSNKCTSCKQCNKVCPMSLNVNDMVKNNNIDSNDCILCGECTKACRFGAVNRVYGKKDIIAKTEASRGV